MVQALQLPQEKNPAVQRIADMLVKSFGEIGEKIRTDLLKAYRQNAEHWHKSFLDAAETSTGPIVPRDSRGRKVGWYADWHHHTEFVKKKQDEYRSQSIENWEDVRKFKGQFRITYKYAEARANESYENARDSFVHKNLDKLREVMGKRTDLKSAVIKFDWVNRSYFKGNLQVYLEGAYFRGDVDVKYVVRTIPRVTPYFQYPLVFVEGEVDGKLYARPSEQELRNLLSGKTDEEHAKEVEAQTIAEGWCPMSGKEAVGVKVRYGSTAYAPCPSCKAYVTVQHYKWRKHKTKAAEKAAEIKKLEDSGYCRMSNQAAPYKLISSFVRPHTVWPGGKETIEYSFNLFDEMGKYRKILCEACGQNVVIGNDRSALKPEDVKAYYRKHKTK